jgi:hypothetical protein
MQVHGKIDFSHPSPDILHAAISGAWQIDSKLFSSVATLLSRL